MGATLQLFVALHERATQSDVASRLSALAFALSHLQAGLMATRSRPDGSRSVEAMAVARHSRCHVIGCDLHIDAKPTQCAKRLQLHDVFLQLMAHDRRDDELSQTPSAPSYQLTSKDVAAFSGVCSLFRHASYEVVPGLKLQLFRHQQTALQWLLHREGSSRQLEHVPHPFFFPSLQHGDDTDASRIDLIDGRLVTFPRTSRAADTRGGLFCDEPGLGKTITMLALLLRTKGQRSNPRALQDERPSTRTTRISPRFAAHGREVDTRDLLPSSATLLIVPRPLLDHWRFQIATHVTRRMLRVFLDDDDSNSDLPPAATLTRYDVVITSFDRLSDHWKFHKPTSASEQNRPNRYGYEDARERFIDGFENRGTSPLLRIHWVRIVVDEGHMLGGRRTTNHMCMAELLQASKRWVMTGTPLPNHFLSEDLRHLHGLLAFLRERPYGEADTKAWTKAIAKPFERNSHEGFVRLLRLLRRIMLRHTKQSILKQIPSPVCHVVLVDATPREFAAYNGIIAGIRLNLVTNQPDPDNTTGTSRLHFNSLLHATNRGYAGVAIRNLRDATCGGGRVRVNLLEKDFDETLAMLHARNVPADRIQEVAAFLRGVVGWDLQCVCPVCSLKFPVLLLIPCGHFVCADCTESQGRQCGVCHVRFDWKAFQAIQLGFEIAIKEDEWHYDGVELFAKPGPRVKKTPLPPGVKELKPKPKKRVFIPIDHSKFSLVSTSKTYYVARRIAELADAFDADEAQPRAARVGVVRPKVIVFSQVRNRIYQLKIALAQHAITSEEFVGGMSAAARTAALVAFRNKPRSTVLLLSDAGSHGLDLSFVTHIFLMEEVLDASLEAQVIARAYRMGAKQQVVVEKLLMRGSLEESLHASRQQRRRDRGEEKEAEGRDEHETEGFRHKLLRSLRAIDESAVTAFGFLRFQVLDENGNLVRADTVRLPNPGDPLPTGQPLSFSKPKRLETAAPLEAEAVEALVELERRPLAITGEPLSVSEEPPTPPRNKTMQVMRSARKVIARIKREPSADDRMSRPPPAASVAVIDLTSDTSDSDVAEENTAMEIDDSETDDEWAEVLKEEKTLVT